MIPTLNSTQINALYAQQNCFCALDGYEVELPAAIEPYELDLRIALYLRNNRDLALTRVAVDKAIQQALEAA